VKVVFLLGQLKNATFQSNVTTESETFGDILQVTVSWNWSRAGLPDGFFSDQKSQFGYILEGLRKDNVVIYSGHLEYFTTIGYILWSFDIFFPSFGTLYQEKSGHPGFGDILKVTASSFELLSC
jgi:hypothetical protein